MHDAVWSSADLHIHTTASDGVATPEMVLEHVCSKTDLRVIAITDHNTNAGGLEAVALAEQRGYPIEVIVGQEVESRDGHIIGLWTPELVRPGMPADQTVAAIHAQGGLAIAAHAFAPRFWDRLGLSRGNRTVYGNTPYDGIEIANSTPLLFMANWVARFYWVLHRERFACTGGSDAHMLPVIGTSRTLFPGENAQDLRRAIEAHRTRARLPGFSFKRNWRYLWTIPEIKSRDRDRRAREAEAGIWERAHDDEGRGAGS